MLSRAGAGALKVGKTMTGSEASEKPSLYDRLGGVYSIATVAARFRNLPTRARARE